MSFPHIFPKRLFDCYRHMSVSYGFLNFDLSTRTKRLFRFDVTIRAQLRVNKMYISVFGESAQANVDYCRYYLPARNRSV